MGLKWTFPIPHTILAFGWDGEVSHKLAIVNHDIVAPSVKSRIEMQTFRSSKWNTLLPQMVRESLPVVNY